MKAYGYYLNEHLALDSEMIPLNLVISLMDGFADQENKELSQENLELKKQNTELAELLKKSVRIVKQMDDHTKKCIDNI